MTVQEPEPDQDSVVDEAKDASKQLPSVLDQMGGISGIAYSTLPVLAFVPVNAAWGLTVAIWAALGVATAVLLWRLVRRDKLQPAVSGFFGVAICALIAYLVGDAKGYFLWGIASNLVCAIAFLGSLFARWPLVGVMWGTIEGHGNDWRKDPVAMRAYSIATAAWTFVFAGRFVVQSLLYAADETGWLAVAKLALGWPPAIFALLVSLWAVRRAGHDRKRVAKKK